MKLLGRWQSPYARRVGVSLQLMGIPFEHDPIPVFDQPDAVRQHNPVTRVPALVLDDGEALVESWAILDWADEQGGDKRLTPASGTARRDVMKATALGLASIDKTVWAVYELRFHPKEKQHLPWIEHNEAQALAGFKWLDGLAAPSQGDGWLVGGTLSQADVTAAIGYTFASAARPKLALADTCPNLARLAARCEAMSAFAACKAQ